MTAAAVNVPGPDVAGPGRGADAGDATRIDTGPVGRVGRLLVRREPWAFAIAWLCWVGFYCLPVPVGLVLREVFDRAEAPGTGVWGWVAVVVGLGLGRWALLALAAVQWNGCWVFWQTLPRWHLLRSLVADPGPVEGRLPSSSGEAVSRFRDDAMHLARLVDVWLDVSGAAIGAGAALGLMAMVEPRAAVVAGLPVVGALVLCQVFARRLRRWRVDERESTAAVTGFIGDTFGAVLAVKTAAAEPAVVQRLAQLGTDRARAARADQVGTQMLQSLSGLTGNIATGLLLLLVLPRIADGELTAGDLALFTSAITVVANLPRWAATLGTYRRQAEVSLERLVELLPTPDPARLAAPSGLDLRHGPPAPVARVVARRAERRGADRLEVLEIEGLRMAGVATTDGPGVDLRLERGTLTVVTGPVGSGKSTLLRAMLGLVAAEGVVRWNGEVLDDPGMVLVPPRVAYVAQAPRLFSERLDETILLGLDDGGLLEALTLARLADDLTRMPDGLATIVGPRGVRLSGGQVQRAAAARALVRQPELLVMDDLSSALDLETEAQLWDGLLGEATARRDGLTFLVVSHRPQVLARADQLVVLDRGRRLL